jgi:hypothetical protein
MWKTLDPNWEKGKAVSGKWAKIEEVRGPRSLGSFNHGSFAYSVRCRLGAYTYCLGVRKGVDGASPEGEGTLILGVLLRHLLSWWGAMWCGSPCYSTVLAHMQTAQPQPLQPPKRLMKVSGGCGPGLALSS